MAMRKYYYLFKTVNILSIFYVMIYHVYLSIMSLNLFIAPKLSVEHTK